MRSYDVAWFMASVDTPEDNEGSPRKKRRTFQSSAIPTRQSPTPTASSRRGGPPIGRSPRAKNSFTSVRTAGFSQSRRRSDQLQAGEEVVAKLAELGVKKEEVARPTLREVTGPARGVARWFPIPSNAHKLNSLPTCTIRHRTCRTGSVQSVHRLPSRSCWPWPSSRRQPLRSYDEPLTGRRVPRPTGGTRTSASPK